MVTKEQTIALLESISRLLESLNALRVDEDVFMHITDCLSILS